MLNNWTGKVLKGEELFYYTQKIKNKINQVEQRIAEDKEELQRAIEEVDQKVDSNKIETDQAIADLADTINKLKLELNVVSKAVYNKYYYDGHTYDTEEEAIEAAREAGDENPEITHSRTIIKLIDKNGNDIEPSHNYLYLVPTEPINTAVITDEPNNYNEYVWEDADGEGRYELIGSTNISLDELSNSDIDNIWHSVFI